MSLSEQKDFKSQQTSTLASYSSQQQHVENSDPPQIQQEETFQAEDTSNNQDILSFEALLISIFKFQKDTSLQDDLNIGQQLRSLWKNNCQACIIRMHYFLPNNRTKINQNRETLQRRLRLFNIEMQPFSQSILAFLKINSDTQKQTKKQVQAQEQIIQSQGCQYGEIIKIYPHTRCQLKLINIQKFKEDYHEFSQSKANIQRLKQKIFQSFKIFFINAQLGDVQSADSQQKNVDIKIILNERVQIQIILTFKDIKQLLYVYLQSLIHTRQNQFFYLELNNRMQNQPISGIEIKVDSVNVFCSETEKVPDSNGQLFKCDDQLQTAEEIRQKQARGGVQKPFQSKQKNNSNIKQNKEYFKPIWGSPGSNNGIYKIQDMFKNNNINRELAKSHIFKLNSWMNENFMEAIVDMVKNYQVYVGLKEDIKKFIGINEYKWYHAKDLYQTIYPQMLPYINYFYSQTGIPTIQRQLNQFVKESLREQQRDKTNEQRVKKQFFKRKSEYLGIQDHFLDLTFEEYLKMELSKNTLKQNIVPVLIEKRKVMQLPQFINRLATFSTNVSHKLDVLKTLIYQYNKRKSSSSNTSQHNNKISSLVNYFPYADSYQINCLGCTPFFYEDMNIKDDIINKTPAVSFQQISRLKKQQIRIKREICSMMNTGGGVILFNCVYQNRQIRPIGEYITERDKQKYEQQIYSFLGCFHPRIEVGTNVLVNFVPVAKSPYQTNRINEKDFNKNALDYNKGCYVTRIIVRPTTIMRPTDFTKVYFWQHEQNEKYFWSYKHNERMTQLKYHAAYKLLKQKFNDFYIPNRYTGRQRRMMQKPNNFFNHICQKPESGVPISYLAPQNQLQSKETTMSTNLEPKYTYMSMIIAKANYHDAIKKRFQSRGIKCEIVEMFKKYMLKNAKNTAVIYHNTRFENLLTIVSFNTQFQFNAKMVLLIRITEYIKLVNRNKNNFLLNCDYQHLCEWLNAEFPLQKIQVWEFNPSLKLSKLSGSQLKLLLAKQFQDQSNLISYHNRRNNIEKQFYISTGSKSSTVFMYFVLNHFKQKAIFKNPANLDQYSSQQKKLVWHQLTSEYENEMRRTMEEKKIRQKSYRQNLQ